MKIIRNMICLFVCFFTFTCCCSPEQITKEEGNYKDGNKDGKWISYCEHGNIIQDGLHRISILKHLGHKNIKVLQVANLGNTNER